MTVLRERPHGAPVGDEPLAESDTTRWEALADRISAGDTSAEAELATRFLAPVRVFASVLLRGSDTAADIAQDTMLAVIEAVRAGRFREPFNLPGFVRGTARNLVNSHFRKAARSPEVSVDPPDRSAAGDRCLPNLDDERRTLVRKALQRLGPVDRRILLLTLVEGMRPREIAPIVGLKVDVVRTRKSRAVKEVTREVERATRMRQPDHQGTGRSSAREG